MVVSIPWSCWSCSGDDKPAITMHSKWILYQYELKDASRPADKQEPYHCEAVIIEPAHHPRSVHAHASSAIEAKARALSRIRLLMERSEIVEI